MSMQSAHGPHNQTQIWVLYSSTAQLINEYENENWVE